MSKYKIKNSLWFVLIETIRIYFSNIDKFLVYMLFPVFGQIIGIILTFALALGFAPKIAETQSPTTALVLILLLTIPGLLIFTKAFWDYMVAYVALNSMTEGYIETGKVYDFQSHNSVATHRAFRFITLLAIVGILSLIGSNILLMAPALIIWVYWILVYQVFTFEEDLKPIECLKRSFHLVKGNWGRTFVLLLIMGFFSIFIISNGVSVVFDYLNLTRGIVEYFNTFTSQIQLGVINGALEYFRQPIITPDMISKSILNSIIGFVVTGLTLPLRSVCWTLWYGNLLNINNNLQEKKAKKSRRKQEYDEE